MRVVDLIDVSELPYSMSDAPMLAARNTANMTSLDHGSLYGGIVKLAVFCPDDIRKFNEARIDYDPVAGLVYGVDFSPEFPQRGKLELEIRLVGPDRLVRPVIKRFLPNNDGRLTDLAKVVLSMSFDQFNHSNQKRQREESET